MTLARQMYPGKTQHFMRNFEEAVSKPYGYLLVDLKPTTPESMRLRCNVLCDKWESKRDRHVADSNHSADTIGMKRSPSEELPVDLARPIKDEQSINNIHSTDSTATEQTYPEELPDEMPSCDDCGVMFENMHDLQRHVKMWCPEHHTLKRKNEFEENDVPVKKRWISYSDIDDEDGNDESEEEKYFVKITEKARENNEKGWQRKREKYMEGGLSEDEAEQKANNKLKDDDVTEIMGAYAETIRDILANTAWREAPRK